MNPHWPEVKIQRGTQQSESSLIQNIPTVWYEPQKFINLSLNPLDLQGVYCFSYWKCCAQHKGTNYMNLLMDTCLVSKRQGCALSTLNFDQKNLGEKSNDHGWGHILPKRWKREKRWGHILGTTDRVVGKRRVLTNQRMVIQMTSNNMLFSVQLRDLVRVYCKVTTNRFRQK